ncbi:MAG: flagellar hook basal-body protein [Betaproteobacteria bacterium]
MSQVLPITLQALQNDSVAMDRISANLVNMTTPGYRREMSLQAPMLSLDTLPGAPSAFASVVEGQRQQAQAVAGVGAAPDLAGLVRFDTRHGTLKTTDAALDVALMGNGFFEIETTQGPAYTRNGQFHLDARGTLVTAQGQPVAGQGGQITLTPGPVTIDASGQVIQNARPVGQLKVVDFEGSATLRHSASGLYTATAPARPMADTEVQVRQGALENSNVDHMTEMVQMVQVMRHFETMARVVQGYDDMMGTAINKLGSF